MSRAGAYLFLVGLNPRIALMLTEQIAKYTDGFGSVRSPFLLIGSCNGGTDFDQIQQMASDVVVFPVGVNESEIQLTYQNLSFTVSALSTDVSKGTQSGI